MSTYAITPVEDLGVEIDRDDPEIAILRGEPDLESIIEGEGDMTYVCADCKTTILEDVELGQVQNIGFECLGCGKILYLPAHGD